MAFNQTNNKGLLSLKNSRNCLETRLFLPHWWVKTYENILRLNWQKLSYKHLQGGGLVPSYSPADFYALSFIFAQIQSAILLAESGTEIVLQPRKISEQVGVCAFNSKQKLAKLVASIQSILLLGQKEEKICTYSLFKKSTFSQGYDGEYCIHLTPNLELVEVLLGYVDSYENLRRKNSSDNLNISEILGTQAPLQIQRSLWLDMKGIEQALLLRVERAVQWDNKLVHVSGVYQECVKELFTNLTLGGKKQQPSSILQKVIALKRFAKKLFEHGFCSFDFPQVCLAFASQEQTMQFLFKKQEHAKCEKEEQFFRDLVAAYFFRRNIEKKYELFKILQVEETFANKVIEAISGLNSVESFLLENNKIVLLPWLFLEWSGRKQHSNSFPSEIATDIISENFALNADSVLEIASKYKKFCAIFKADTKYIYFIQTKQKFSIVNSDRENIKKDETVAQKIIIQQSSKQYSSKEQEAFSDFGKSQEMSKDSAVTVLQRLSLERGESYIRLTNSYIESLDQRQKQLMLDIRKQMQARTFDQHIRERLLQFMLANPPAWQEYVQH